MIVILGLVIIGLLWMSLSLHRRRQRPRRPTPQLRRKEAYEAYLGSRAWRWRKKRATRGQRHRCQWNVNYDRYVSPSVDWRGYRRGCTAAAWLEGHHLTYEHFRHERKGEVVWLCRHHHALVPNHPHPPFVDQQVFFGIRSARDLPVVVKR